MLTIVINTCKYCLYLNIEKCLIPLDRYSLFPDVLIFLWGLYKTNFSRRQSDYSDINKSKREPVLSIDPVAMFFGMTFLFVEILAVRVKASEISEGEEYVHL